MFRYALLPLFALLTVVGGVEAQTPKERVVLDALNELKRLEKKGEVVQQGDKNGAVRVLRRMKIVKLKLDGAKDKTHESWVATKKRFDALEESLYAKMGEAPPKPGEDGPVDMEKLGELDADVRRSYSKLKAMQVNDLRDPKVVKALSDLVAGYRKRLEPMPAGNENVRTVKRNIDSLENLVNIGLKQLQTNDQAAGVQSRMDAITSKYRRANLPPALAEPLEPEAVKAWAAGLTKRLEVELPRDMAALQELAKDPTVNKQRLSSANSWVGNNGRSVLEETLYKGRMKVDGLVETSERMAKFIMETDPQDRSHVLNRLLREGSLEHYTNEMQLGLKRVAVARAFDEGCGKPQKLKRDAQKQRIETAMNHFRQCMEVALKEVRMPKAKSTDKALLETAGKVLKANKVKGWKRMVVSYDVQDREKQSGSIHHGTTSSTVTVYHYVWKEYNVHTAEKVGDEWYIFINKFRRYSKGDERTTLDAWILYDRFSTTRILEENIDK